MRQPARGGLAVLGVAAIGALLFDMLMLSQGLVTSMRDLLDRTGWDVRVTASVDTPGRGPRITGVAGAVSAIAALPQVRAAVAANRNVDTARCASTRAVRIGFAASPAIVRANSSVRSESDRAA